MKSSGWQWQEPQPIEVAPELRQSVGGSPLLAETLVKRGISTPEQALAFLDASRYSPASSSELPDLGRAVERLSAAIRSQERIGVWGDFDVDGQTSTTLLVDALRRLRADVIYHIPVRASESHGVNQAGLEAFHSQGVQIVLTCDTGVSAHEAVEFASARGMEVIITDHHTLPDELPKAFAVVNPQRLPTGHPLASLSGVGCAYKLVEALFELHGFAQETWRFLDLVALGLVADLAILTGDARYLTQRGLQVLRDAPRPAIRAILESAEIAPSHLTEEHIGFVLAPRLNALGRLADANPIVEFLITTDPHAARQTALRLEGLNNRRKLLCDQVFQAIQAQIERDRSLLDTPALVFSHPEWPAGVIGIVASRLVELYHRPALLISAPPTEAGRGSARSVEGINITKALAASQEFLLGYGGHAMAAGFGIDPQRIPDFSRAVSQEIERQGAGRPELAQLPIDAYLPLEYLSLELVDELERLSPFGPGNPALIFATRDLTLKSTAYVGKGKEHLQLVVEDPSGVTCKTIWWQGAGSPLPDGKFDLAYTARASNFRGQRQIQIEWINARQQEPELVADLAAPKSITVHDFRQHPQPLAKLAQVMKDTGAILWKDGNDDLDFPALDRCQLRPAQTLIIWSIPPDRAELEKALEIVQAQRMILFGRQTSSDQPGDFLKRLAGMCRFALNHRAGWVSLPALAAAANQRPISIRKGLDWLVAHGDIALQQTESDRLQIIKGGKADPLAQSAIEKELRLLLSETAAFRSYYLRADPNSLIYPARPDTINSSR